MNKGLKIFDEMNIDTTKIVELNTLSKIQDKQVIFFLSEKIDTESKRFKSLSDDAKRMLMILYEICIEKNPIEQRGFFELFREAREKENKNKKIKKEFQYFPETPWSELQGKGFVYEFLQKKLFRPGAFCCFFVADGPMTKAMRQQLKEFLIDKDNYFER